MARPALAPHLSADMAAAIRAFSHHVAKAGPKPACRGDIDADRAAYDRATAFRQADGPDVTAVADIHIPASHGTIPARIYRPRATPILPALIYAHGGGWYLGGLESHDRLCRRMANESDAAVIAVDYRLAPEHRHPAQVEDVRTVADWARTKGFDHGLDGSRLALGGDSAGAHMALAAALADRNAGLPQPAALLLLYGAFGLRDGTSHRLWGGPEDGLAPADLAYMYSLVQPDTAARALPDFDLLANDMTGLPPMHIVAAELDPLLDDSRALAALVKAAGGQADLVVFPGVLHAFMMLDRLIEAGDEAIRGAGAFLAGRLRP